MSDGGAIGWTLDAVTVRMGHRAILSGVSLRALAGSVVAVVGGDGAGKSTLLRTLVGAVKPEAGTVRVPVRDRIGYLASSSGTYPDLTVTENLEFAAAAYGVRAAVARERIAGLLARTGLDTVAGRLAGNLSGGMRQKLGIVRAVLHEPDMLVLDEPTTGVDPISRADVWWLIAREATRGCAVVLSTTYLDEAERATQVLVLDAGQALAAGTAADIIAAVPGTVRRSAIRPRTTLAWRRAGSWRSWDPATGDTDMEAPPDLHDALIVAALGREKRHE